MTTERAWTEDPATLLQHQVLRALAATGETEDIEIAHAIGSGPAEVREVFTDLVRSGLAAAATPRAGDTDPHEVSLTREGSALARQREAARTVGAMRRACESAMLTWLFALDGRHVTDTDELAHDVRGQFFGVPFDELTLHAAARTLYTDQLITGLTGDDKVLSPYITDVGRAVVVRHDADPSQWRSTPHGGSTVYTISGSSGVNIATNSPGAVQSIDLGRVHDKANNLADAVTQAIDALGLPTDERTRLVELADQLRTLSREDPQTDPSRWRRVVSTVNRIVVSGSGAALGTGIAALGDELLQLLP